MTYQSSSPEALADFRKKTGRQAMLGISTIPSLTLSECYGKRRTTRSGSVDTKGKFTCHGCGRK